MTTLYLPKVNIPTSLGYVWEATSWYLATSPDFSDESIIRKSENDTVNKTSICIDYELLQDTVYYYKALIITNKAIIETNVNILHVKDSVLVARDTPIPSAVMTPTITIDNNNNSMFTITSSGFNTTSNAKLIATTYLIETLDGKAVYSSIFDNDHLTTLQISDIVLLENTPYLIKVAHHSSSGDVSQFGSLGIITKDTTAIQVTSDTIGVTLANDVGITIAPIDDFKEMNISIYAIGLGKPSLVTTTTSTALSTTLSSSLFTSDSKRYLIGIDVIKTDNSTIGTKYTELTTL